MSLRWIVGVGILCVAGLAMAGEGGVAAGLSDQEKQEGFVSLFDGKTLEGWIGATGSFAVEDGMLVFQEGKTGNLFSEKEYGDFVLKLQYRLGPGGNNGVALRCPAVQDQQPAYIAMEIQILDDSSDKYIGKIHDYQFNGSIYGVVPAKKGHMKPVGQWNEYEITCKGYDVRVKLNDVVIVDANLEKLGFQRLNDKPGDGLKAKKGHIGFNGHNDRVEFRNIRIKEL